MRHVQKKRKREKERMDEKKTNLGAEITFRRLLLCCCCVEAKGALTHGQLTGKTRQRIYVDDGREEEAKEKEDQGLKRMEFTGFLSLLCRSSGGGSSRVGCFFLYTVHE